MTAFIDHGQVGTGEAARRPAAAPWQRLIQHRRRPHHRRTARSQPDAGSRAQTPATADTDSGGGTHAFLTWVTARRLKYSIGFNLTDDICTAIGDLLDDMWHVTVWPLAGGGQHAADSACRGVGAGPHRGAGTIVHELPPMLRDAAV
jgi:hypothetical protein